MPRQGIAMSGNAWKRENGFVSGERLCDMKAAVPRPALRLSSASMRHRKWL